MAQRGPEPFVARCGGAINGFPSAGSGCVERVTDAGPEILLRCSISSDGGARRTREPVTFGLPFPKGRIHDSRFLSIAAQDGTTLPLQVNVLDRWNDGSVRWALVDFQPTCSDTGPAQYRVSTAAGTSTHGPALTIQTVSGGAVVKTGAADFHLSDDGRLTVSGVNGSDDHVADCHFRLIDSRDGTHPVVTPRVSSEIEGPMRCVLVAAGSVDTGARRPLELTARYHFYAGLPVVRIVATLRNPARATHRGGYWELGDPGSQNVRDLSFLITTPGAAPDAVFCSPEDGMPLRNCADTVLLYQGSSGGENWNSPNHRNRSGALPVRFRGYQLQSGADHVSGLRATPVMRMELAATAISVAQRRFWQRFPKAVSVADGTLRLGLLPGEFLDGHELQGGEQITEEFVVSFADDGIAERALDWVRQPLRVSAEPEWYRASEAMPHLTTIVDDDDVGHLALVNAAIEGDDTFERKREQVDEYGWRHFGDLYADHEAVFHKGTDTFVSHYNNQYDAMAGMAVQYFRSQDLRWFDLLDDLARHVIDTDVYHTTDDRAAYNGGLFWHTAHHIHADLSTHRTYPRSGGASGGPAPEHNYNTGLMLYYFLTGDPRARDAAISLATWVIDMDDGAKTPLKWISRARTGLPSATGSYSYHGPGRGPGNSIVALLNGFRLTGERVYLEKVEELVRRCVHPADDLEALDLLDAERRWFYTVFLQALGRYLYVKEEHNDLDDTYAYARAVLLHYARWMIAHEYPYLDKPEILEFPNETWAAQDMRKSEVFNYASRYADSALRLRLLERSRFFFHYSISTLLGMPTRTFTRPLVLMLTNGNAQQVFQQMQYVPAPVVDMPRDFGTPTRFVPQKKIALRRLAILAALLAAAAALGIVAALAL